MSEGAEALLRRWATDTWRSLDAMTFPNGLPGDSVGTALALETVVDRTSPSNIAAGLWGLLVAEELGLVPEEAARARLRRTLETLADLPRHSASGMFYNWYQASTGGLLEMWHRGRLAEPFVSSVDNGWLVMALMMVAEAHPSLRGRARGLIAGLDFRVFYNPDARESGGLLRGGFWGKPQGRRSEPAEHLAGAPVHATRHHYDLLNSEPRILVYVGALLGQIPARVYRTLEAPRRHYRGRDLIASLGGAMFEALTPAMFIPEEDWAPELWGRNHAGTAAAQREYGLEECGYPAWGFSPAACPGRGYREFGVRHIGLLLTRYGSEFRGQGVVTPHAAMLALGHEPDAVRANLSRIEGDLGCYGPGGFIDSVAVRTRLNARRYLAVDQGFVMAALGNHLAEGVLRRHFCTPEAEAVLRPLVLDRARRADDDGARPAASA